MHGDDRDDGQPDGSELDFWIGEWDARWDGGGTGTNRVSRILGDRVVYEEFTGQSERGTLEGRSFSVFDADQRLWRQTWVDDHGSYLELVGDRMEGQFVFRRAARELGAGAEQRMVFRDIEANRFHWTWESSADGWLTHSVEWAIDYRRRSARAAR